MIGIKCVVVTNLKTILIENYDFGKCIIRSKTGALYHNAVNRYVGRTIVGKFDNSKRNVGCACRGKRVARLIAGSNVKAGGITCLVTISCAVVCSISTYSIELRACGSTNVSCAGCQTNRCKNFACVIFLELHYSSFGQCAKVAGFVTC